MDWSPQQNAALSKAGVWLRTRYQQSFYLAGYAGTGKSTLAMHLASYAKGKVAYAAFTGKAARVMRSKGCVGASTIHSLIYDVFEDPASGEIKISLKHPNELSEYSLIVIDECSMVNEEMGKDLLSFGKPVLVLGDPAQLPPVKGGGYFTGSKPDFMLTEIHRQAAESPIVRLATEVREGKFRNQEIDTPGLLVCKRSNLNRSHVTGADIVIVGRNDTRQKYNKRLRELAGISDLMPVKGEPLICLRNDRSRQVYNGDILTVARRRANKGSISLWLEDPEGERARTQVCVKRQFFIDDVEASKIPFDQLRDTQQFTYGYAITCHKSQGSQWGNVCVFNESRVFSTDAERWLYTAVTRASEHLTLVI